ncbi:hypothetical protein [Salinicola tamaricis]|uniref:hypothetical protein n=1 Tax=Salinicola tamaricis TaxID=1771309 RepID=UPI0013ED2F63|nr:hypothetical protein [Salinicola tamaricis]
MENLENRKIVEFKDFDYQLPVLAAVREAMEGVLPGLRNPRTALAPLRFLMDYDSPRGTIEQRIEQLSDGYRISSPW